MSRRDQIRMTPAEIRAFLDEQRTVICASNGADGWPHLMPLWFIVRGDDIWAWTYAKSQKVLNLERDPRATLQIEAGEQYGELRGVMFKATTELHRDTEEVAALGAELLSRYGGGDAPLEVNDVILAQARKRIALQFILTRTASWDHRKLGDTY
jgi:PPOX class probable F420-dependent enzyme